MLSVTLNGIEYRFYDHLYAVSACGLVLRQLEPYTPIQRPDGYLSVGRRRLMHRLVATCWIEKPANATQVHHVNGDKTDNRASNLVWVTPKEHFGYHHKGTHGKHEVTAETKAKLRAARLGTKQSDATKQKKREIALRLGLRPPAMEVGSKHKPETIAKMSANNAKSVACEVDGVAYVSFTQAGKALGIRPLTLRKRCLSTNFPTYRLLGD